MARFWKAVGRMIVDDNFLFVASLERESFGIG